VSDSYAAQASVVSIGVKQTYKFQVPDELYDHRDLTSEPNVVVHTLNRPVSAMIILMIVHKCLNSPRPHKYMLSMSDHVRAFTHIIH